MNKVLPNAEWLKDRDLQKLLKLLSADGEEAMVNGGAVRNSLLGEPVADVDLSTTLLPEQVVEKLQNANIKVVPTGIEHGTVTAVLNKRPFEITTLRSDIETNGRHAVVRFGRDWLEDAKRRDFSVNALYVDKDGKVFDPLEGMVDIEARRIRFIGDAEDRIKEDYLRILRFFRFFAWYGTGAPDREALKACVRMKNTIEDLSVERVWNEFRKLLSAPDPARAILWMRQSGVLNVVLPESEKWGIDAFQRLVRTEVELDWAIDPLLRLMAIIPPQRDVVSGLADRLRLSKVDGKRLLDWANSVGSFDNMDENELQKLMYKGSRQGIIDRFKLDLARLRELGMREDAALVDAARISDLLDFALAWEKPRFPLKGKDLIELGYLPGKELGDVLNSLEERWIDNKFSLSKEKLLAELKEG